MRSGCPHHRCLSVAGFASKFVEHRASFWLRDYPAEFHPMLDYYIEHSTRVGGRIVSPPRCCIDHHSCPGNGQA